MQETQAEHSSLTSNVRLMLGSIALALAVLALFLTQFDWSVAEAPPGGLIGFRDGQLEVWVDTSGKEAGPPAAWPLTDDGLHLASISAPGVPQFPSPDGRATAFVLTVGGPGGHSALMLLEGGDIRRIATLSEPGSPELIFADKGGASTAGGVPLVVRWSPDGRTLAWGSVHEAPYNLNLTSRADWRVQTVPLVGGYVGELGWSPDGEYLAISTYGQDRTDHTLLALRPEQDERPRQLGKGCIMVWSPDSRHLAFHGEPATMPGIWVVSVDGEARQITGRLGVAPFAWVAE